MPSQSGKITIVGLGDSTTAGTPGFRSPVESPPKGEGNEESQYAFWLMKAHPEWVVMNRGVNGERTDEIFGRFRRDVEAEAPRVVVVLGGVNDIYQGYPVEFTKENLSSIYDGVSRIGAECVGCSVLPYNTITPSQAMARRLVNEWVKEECARRKMQYCDTASSVAKAGDQDLLEGTPDGIHPDVKGYRRMADAIQRGIETALHVLL